MINQEIAKEETANLVVSSLYKAIKILLSVGNNGY